MMTDQPTPNEFDDELLSAYLDDELSAEECARVEARLAADPAARQTLEQLRAVSRAVQGLPYQSLGEDLRGAVLQRAERAMLAPSTAPVGLHKPSPDGDVQPLPRFTIGRSARGWVWAGLAVAAALFIMVVQREERRGENLPDVAVARRANDAVRRLAREDTEVRGRAERPAPATAAPIGETTARSSVASVEPAPPSVPAVTAAPAAPSAESLAAGGRRVTRSDVGDRLSPGVERELPASESGVRAPPQSGGRTRPGSRTPRLAEAAAPDLGSAVTERQPADELSSLAPAIAENEVLVVHVNVRPAALRSQAFDRLLVSNGIVVEQPADKDQEPVASGRVSAGVPAAALAGADQPTAGPPAVDAVLVEAPVAQIERCLEDVEADKDTYLGVAIDEASVDEKAPAGKLASERNWQRYNRGQVPRQQQVEIAPHANVFYDAQGRLGYGGIGGGFGGSAARGAQQPLGKSGDLSSVNGRAMRMQAQQLDGRQVVQQLRTRTLAPGESAADDFLHMGTARLGGSTQREADDDMLQVLFVLSSEPTSSPAAGDRVP